MGDLNQDVSGPLLEFLGDEWALPGLRYAAAPRPILGGNATFIYGFALDGASPDLSGDLVLRLFRSDQGAASVRVEAVIQQEVARLGYSAPNVLAVCTDLDVLGAPFIVMERAEGSTLLSGLAPTRTDALRVDVARLLVTLPRSFVAMPRTIAAFQVQLHGLDPEPLVDRLTGEGLAPAEFLVDRDLDRIESSLGLLPQSTQSAFAGAVDWMRKHPPIDASRRAICHGDFHPLNVMSVDGRVTGVIDWTDAVVAPPAYDVAQTRFLFELGPLSLPRPMMPAARVGQRYLSRLFSDAYGKLAGGEAIEASALDYYESLRILRELVGVARERLIDAGVFGGAARPSGNPWDRDGLTTKLIARLALRTGVRVALPAA